MKESSDLRWSNDFKGKRVLVTGHTGFKGSWLAYLLTQWGADVQGYALEPLPGSTFQALQLDKKLRHFIGDIRDAAALERTVCAFDPEIVFHLAAQPLVRRSYQFSKETFDVNVGGTVNLLEAAKSLKNLRAFVFVSSDKCYSNSETPHAFRESDALGGNDPYSASKAAAEIVVASYRASFFPAEKVGIASARAGNVIGGGDWSEDRLMPDCMRALQAKETVRVRNPESVRPWQHVLEPVVGYLQLASRLLQDPQKFSSAWNFGPDQKGCLSVWELTQEVLKTWGSGEARIEQDAAAVKEAKLLRLDCAKAKDLLQWESRWTAEQAVQSTVEWYRFTSQGGDASEITDLQIRDYFGQS